MSSEPALPNPTPTSGGFLMEALIFLGIIGFWVVLNIWILPKAGFNT
ncbi:MAG: hypothetical protein K2X38_20705 [Gemmataceae bacterium]|nr:hypothetical protein [Gemmataceae bacterium]